MAFDDHAGRWHTAKRTWLHRRATRHEAFGAGMNPSRRPASPFRGQKLYSSQAEPSVRESHGGGRIGYAAGAFDLFHVGHLNLLRQARSRCDFLIAGVVSDELILARKGRQPVIPLSERLEIVRNVGFVDEAIAETLPNKVDMWQQRAFNVLFKGDDWKGTSKGLELEQDFRPFGVEIVYFPYTVHTSSTILRRTLELIDGEFTQDGNAHRLSI